MQNLKNHTVFYRTATGGVKVAQNIQVKLNLLEAASQILKL